MSYSDRWCRAIALALACLALLPLDGLKPVSAQVLYHYVEQSSGANNEFPLGYPVPWPVDSASPVAGFRSYAGLHNRHQDLMLNSEFITGHVVGETASGREIWAYLLSDADRLTAYGDLESAALVNGNIHAREWQSPETSTAMIETLIANQSDASLHQYLLENVSWVVLPVLNVDGLLQTQRYPDQVLVGADPGQVTWPRDGRMRRKNMRRVDEDLMSRADHLLGVDLNRNFPPYWMTPGVSSGNPSSLIFHGPAPISESESLALVAASVLADQSRMRWYADFHSYGVITISKRTSIRRRNALQADLLNTFRNHHGALSAVSGRARFYQDFPDPINSGAGYTVGLFADELQIPSWIVEIEPSAAAGLDYGGLGAEHDGFILPDNQINRVRRDLAAANMMVAYQQAGPPIVQAMVITDIDLDLPVYAVRWVNAGEQTRQLQTLVDGPLVKGRRYSVWLAFNKPMRWREGGDIVPAPGLVEMGSPEVRLIAQALDRDLPAADGQWLDGTQMGLHHHARYRDDAFEFNFRLPNGLAISDGDTAHLSISVSDMAGLQNDAMPQTVVDWVDGGWRFWESSGSGSVDIGGPDQSYPLRVVDEAHDFFEIVWPQQVEEGTANLVRVRRMGSGAGTLHVQLALEGAAPDQSYLLTDEVVFANGSMEDQFVALVVRDNLVVDSQRELTLIASSQIHQSRTFASVLDNDEADHRLFKVVSPLLDTQGSDVSMHEQLTTAIRGSRSLPATVTIELPENAILQTNPTAVVANSLYPTVRGHVTIKGNGATFRRQDAFEPYRFFSVRRHARLTVHDAHFEGGLALGKVGGAFSNFGTLELDTVTFSGNSAGDGGAIWSRGTLVGRDLQFEANSAHRGGAVFDGLGTVNLEEVLARHNTSTKGIFHIRGEMTMTNAVIEDNDGGKAALNGVGEATLSATTLRLNEPRNCLVITIVDAGDNLDDDATCLP